MKTKDIHVQIVIMKEKVRAVSTDTSSLFTKANDIYVHIVIMKVYGRAVSSDTRILFMKAKYNP